MPTTGSTAYTTARSVTALVRALLNDSGTLSVPVAIGNISRNAATGVVTVTTSLPHNMVPGDFSVTSQVPSGTSNFNGTFAVQTVLNNLQYTYNQAGVADTQAAGRSQGVGIGAVYTDTVLMPYVNMMYQTLGRKLETIGDPTYIVDGVELVVAKVAGPDPSVQVVVNDATAAPNQLPTNLLKPLKIWERQNGSTDEFTEMTNLTENGGLPSREQATTLGVWEWRQDGLYFVGATVDTQIRIRFEAYFADLVDGTSSMLLRNSREQIATPAAIVAAESRGAQLPPTLAQLGEDALEDVMNIATRQMQRKNFRMRGYSRRRGTGTSS